MITLLLDLLRLLPSFCGGDRQLAKNLALRADRGWGKAIQEVAVTRGNTFKVVHLHYPAGYDPLAKGDGEETLALPEKGVSLPPGLTAFPAGR